MIIAIAVNENNLNAFVDPHFGRCNWYYLFDLEKSKGSFIENPAKNNPEKAGCDAAEFLLDKNISMAIAGRFGLKVVDVFRSNNIQMVIPQSQQILSEIINQIK
jgi:predicted Fe-Mo cluster-binding NifX family protein